MRIDMKSEMGYLSQRHNEDVTVNKYGRNLMNIIEQSHLIILNGRVLGDLKGSKTCHKYNGSSTVDYMIFFKRPLEQYNYISGIRPCVVFRP